MLSSEWLVGTIGLSAYFGMKRPGITQAMVSQALQVEKYVKRRAEAWAAAKKPAKLVEMKLNENDYDMIVTALQNPNQAQPDISSLPTDMALDFLTAFVDIGYYLHENMPSLQLSGGLIAREIEPPSSDKTRFVWSCNIINDVRLMFDLLDSGAVTEIEGKAFTTLFPEIAMLTAVTYLKTAINFMYDNEKPTMASWQLQGLSAMLGVRLTDFSDVLGWQVGYDEKGPGRPVGAKTVNFAKSNLTDSQKLDSPA